VAAAKAQATAAAAVDADALRPVPVDGQDVPGSRHCGFTTPHTPDTSSYYYLAPQKHRAVGALSFLLAMAEWPAAEQRKFESALQQTRSLPQAERWGAVADVVGKSKGECIARVSFALVVDLVLPLGLGCVCVGGCAGPEC
jgi:hypothetical protein